MTADEPPPRFDVDLAAATPGAVIREVQEWLVRLADHRRAFKRSGRPERRQVPARAPWPRQVWPVNDSSRARERERLRQQRLTARVGARQGATRD